MISSTRRCLAALGTTGLLVLGACARGDDERVEAADTSEATPVAAISRWVPRVVRPTTTTTLRRTTTTTQPPVTTTQPPVTTTTRAPAPTTTRPPATTTTRPPAPTTTVAPTTTAPPPPTTTAPPTGGLSSAAQSELLTLVNAVRATGTTCGGVRYGAVPALTLQGQLTAAAQAHAADMATRNYFSHTGQNGSTPATRITAAGYRWSAWAENIAAGQTSAGSVVAGWFASAGHCANFMNGNVTQIGFGQALNPASTYRVYWVADLGRPG